MIIRILIFAIPAFFIYLFINEYMKQKRQAEENWNNQWEEKKKSFKKEQELKEKEREIQKLKNKLETKDKTNLSEESQQNDNWYSSN